jgi:hypothetical protein
MYVNVDPVVWVRLRLEFETVDLIKRLLSTRPMNVSAHIHVDTFRIDYEPKYAAMFDSGILDALSGLNSKEEFMMKLANVSEFRVHAERDLHDRAVICLRRKVEYGQPDREKHNYYMFDEEEECINFMDYHDYVDCDGHLLFYFCYKCDGMSQLIGTYFHASYPGGPRETPTARDLHFRREWSHKYPDYQDPDNTVVSNIFNRGRGYGSKSRLVDCVNQFLNNIQKGIDYFKELGFDEDEMIICNKEHL